MRWGLLLVLVVPLLFGGGCRSLVLKRPALERPEVMYNVLYVTAESMNVSHLDLYGYAGRHTSDDLVVFYRGGTMFEDCITASCWTSENMVSYMTGMWAPTHGVDSRGKHIGPEWYTPLERLRDMGYSVPRMQAFQADTNQGHLGFVGREVEMTPEQWLEEHGDRPFFMWFHILHTHLPYHPKNWAKQRFWREDLIPNEASRARVEQVMNNGVVVKGSVDFVPEEDAPAIHALYDGEVLRVDQAFAYILRKLDALGLRDKTIVIFSADHGEELLEHGFVGHASTAHDANLYDEVLRIPLIIAFPPSIPAGKVVEQQVRGIDIMPTIFDLLGLAPLEQFHGRSLMPLIRGEETASRPAFVSTSKAGYKEEDPEHIREYRRALRTDDWKLIVHEVDGEVVVRKLYDLQRDPGEHRDVAAEYPEVVAEMSAALEQWLVDCRGWEKKHVRGGNVDPAYRTSWWGRLMGRLFPPKEIDLTGVPSPPEFLVPADGEVLTATSTQGRVEVRWSGRADVPYLLEVAAGEGDYAFSNQIEVTGPEEVRNFQPSYWEEFLVDYDPVRLRVRIDRPGHEWSDWITVRLQ